METSVEDVYASGDLLGPSKIMPAHVASTEGLVAAENAMDRHRAMGYNIVPSAIFTIPEVACVGLTEAQASYTDDHEWCKQEGDNIKVGITDYAQDQLGDIVFVELPEVGTSFDKGEAFGTLESVKAVSELYMPISGEVLAVNEALDDAPELVNKEPYQGDG
jgi:glycine cleavage system H protein